MLIRLLFIVMSFMSVISFNNAKETITAAKWGAFRVNALTVLRAAQDKYAIDQLEGKDCENAVCEYTCHDLENEGYIDIADGQLDSCVISVVSGTVMAKELSSDNLSIVNATLAEIAEAEYGNKTDVIFGD